MTTTPFLSRVPSVGLAVSSLMLLGVLAQGPAGNQTPVQLPIGVVDVAKVLDAYPKSVQEQKKLEEKKKEIFDWYNGEVAKLKERQLDIDGSTGRDREMKELQMDTSKSQLVGLRRIREAIWQEDAAKYVAWSHEELDAAINQIAKARNLQLVLRMQAKPGDKESIGRKAEAYDRRLVWYASEQIDITTEVIRLLQVPPPTEPANHGKSGTQPGTPRTDGKE